MFVIMLSIADLVENLPRVTTLSESPAFDRRAKLGSQTNLSEIALEQKPSQEGTD